VGYAEKVLQPGESIKHRSKVHWIIYLPGLGGLAVAVVIFLFALSADAMDTNLRMVVTIGAALVGIAALLKILKAWFKRWTTEIVVTDKRIIYKAGFIRRNTVEMNLDKVESVQVEQSVMGRLLDYGTLIIRGTGAGIEPVRNVGSPLEFRSFVTAR
jgi:uncharacterized membrane protein YdbT with pleckstrin-like domain